MVSFLEKKRRVLAESGAGAAEQEALLDEEPLVRRGGRAPEDGDAAQLRVQRVRGARAQRGRLLHVQFTSPTFGKFKTHVGDESREALCHHLESSNERLLEQVSFGFLYRTTDRIGYVGCWKNDRKYFVRNERIRPKSLTDAERGRAPPERPQQRPPLRVRLAPTW